MSSSWLSKVLRAVSNAPFTEPERTEITEQIRALHDDIAELKELNQDQREAIRELLADQKESSERLGKKDWLMAAIGAGTALVLTGVVPPMVLAHLAAKVIHELGHLFQGE